MTVAFYMDEHIHLAITLGLRLRDVDVLTVQEDNRIGISDLLILERASELRRVIFTQDQDFLVEADRRQVEGIHFSGVIYAHRRMTTIGECIRDLEIIAKASELEDLTNCVQYLPL
jgi:hypothetical protein